MPGLYQDFGARALHAPRRPHSQENGDHHNLHRCCSGQRPRHRLYLPVFSGFCSLRPHNHEEEVHRHQRLLPRKRRRQHLHRCHDIYATHKDRTAPPNPPEPEDRPWHHAQPWSIRLHLLHHPHHLHPADAHVRRPDLGHLGRHVLVRYRDQRRHRRRLYPVIQGHRQEVRPASARQLLRVAAVPVGGQAQLQVLPRRLPEDERCWNEPVQLCPYAQPQPRGPQPQGDVPRRQERRHPDAHRAGRSVQQQRGGAHPARRPHRSPHTDRHPVRARLRHPHEQSQPRQPVRGGASAGSGKGVSTSFFHVWERFTRTDIEGFFFFFFFAALFDGWIGNGQGGR